MRTCPCRTDVEFDFFGLYPGDILHGDPAEQYLLGMGPFCVHEVLVPQWYLEFSLDLRWFIMVHDILVMSELKWIDGSWKKNNEYGIINF